jgi:hypothetical protein
MGGAARVIVQGEPCPVPTYGKGAVLSDCGLYRYLLWRIWKPEAGRILWIGYNPSTADARIDDPTVTRITGFSQGFGGFELVNLYAFRSSNPAAARGCVALGPESNAQFIQDAMLRCSTVVPAWGALVDDRDQLAIDQVIYLSERHNRRLHCLGTTKEGHPRHPLYVKASQGLVPWRPPCA